MAFTSWDALRTAMKDALADHIAGSPMSGEYSIGNRRIKYRSYKELENALEGTYKLEGLESAGNPSSMVSYGKYMGF